MTIARTDNDATIFLEVICDEDGRKYDEIVEIEKEDFIQIILRLHQANSS